MQFVHRGSSRPILSSKNFDLLYTIIDYSIGEMKFLEDK